MAARHSLRALGQGGQRKLLCLKAVWGALEQAKKPTPTPTPTPGGLRGAHILAPAASQQPWDTRLQSDRPLQGWTEWWQAAPKVSTGT